LEENPKEGRLFLSGVAGELESGSLNDMAAFAKGLAGCDGRRQEK
jgi:hypothetical protein